MTRNHPPIPDSWERNSSRREFLRLAGASALAALLPGCHPSFSSLTAPSPNRLGTIGHLPVDKKMRLLEQVYQNVAFGPTGIHYSMLRYDGDEIRPFQPDDFTDKSSISPSVGRLELDSPADYLHGENSIYASGQHLHAETLRYQVTQSPHALREARRCFRSLQLIYQMGVDQGNPGWMGKPYGFRPSVQTSGDQYCHATRGLLAFHEIASRDERALVEQMIVDFATYWRKADYVISYFGSQWDQKGETDSYNAIYAMISLAAWNFSKDKTHLREFETFMERETWTRTTRMETLRAQARQRVKETGKAELIPYSAAFSLAKDLLKPGEILCWETTIHSAFVVTAADVIASIDPTFLDGRTDEIVARWWKEWKYGMDESYQSYYWFAVDLLNDTWRRLPQTEILPKEQWLWGDPFTSYISQVRWMDPTARALVSSSVAARRCPDLAHDANALIQNILANLTPDHFRWLHDPDGTQLLDEIDYYGRCLSSEVPASVLIAYWSRQQT